MDITRELHFYFQTNDRSDCDPGILWEAHKTVLRGVLIKHGSQLQKRNRIALQLHNFLHSIPNTQRFNHSVTCFEEYCSDDGTLTQVLILC